ncbi:MAG: 16S rRNA (guanine(966)-N(2))-methyltransferase RsmD [Desulfobacteraceae bacterium]|nr:16S rRNA (guanine(966)-N(2))-methyltransferase RsmD [Desulfobacteraceae bacterium]
MRITGGQAKGRVLASLKGWNIRPTSDRVREAIFNLIGQDVTGLKILDLFAGTGSLGIEALSRGASRVLFIDNSLQSIKLIKKNLARSGYEPLGFVWKKDLTKGLPLRHPMLKEKFDLIFVDPPYEKEMIPPLLGELSDRDLLGSPAIAVAESFKTEMLPEVLGKLQMVKSRIYGETKISIYHFHPRITDNK